jgi:hypothetical protein
MSNTKTCAFWRGDCGQIAVSEVKSKLYGGWVPICGQHKNALERRKTGIKPQFRPLALHPAMRVPRSKK